MSEEKKEQAPEAASQPEQQTAPQADNKAAASGSDAAAASQEPTIEQLQADVERFRELALRTQADFENFRKRNAREREEIIKTANANLLERLLPVIDNFELGLQAAQAEGNKAILTGFEMVARQLQDFLTSSGVEVIDAAEGQPFDHNLHDALGTEESDTVPEGHIIRQVRKGYRLKGRLLRPANVFVSKGKPAN